MLGVQQPHTPATHHTTHPTTISPSTKTKKLSLSSTKQQSPTHPQTINQELDSAIAWQEIAREEPDEEEEEEKLDQSAHSNNTNVNANGTASNTVVLTKHNPVTTLSENFGNVESNNPSQLTHLSQLDHLGPRNGHIGSIIDSAFDYPNPSVDTGFGMDDSFDAYLNMEADIVGPSESDPMSGSYLNISNDHIGTSKDDPVPVTSGEQEQETTSQTQIQPQPIQSETKAPSRNLTPLSELSPSPSAFNADGDRSLEENGEQADSSSMSLKVDVSKIDSSAVRDPSSTGTNVDANAQPSSALTELSSQQSPPSASNNELNANDDTQALNGGTAQPASLSGNPGAAKPGASHPPSAQIDVNGLNSQQASSQATSSPSIPSGNHASASRPLTASQPPSPPKLGQPHQQLQQLNVRPQNPYPSVLPYAFASGSGFQIPNIPIPKREGDTNRKVMTVLELNAELFKVCLAYQSQGVSWNSAEAVPYSRKLQSNLTWLASHYDAQKNTAAPEAVDPELPELEAPLPSSTSVTLPQETTERIQSLYKQMATLFARDVAKRERRTMLARAGLPNTPAGIQNLRHGMQPNMVKPTPSPTPSLSAGSLTSTGLKRDRSEAGVSGLGVEGNEVGGSPSAKRRDTGEGKAMGGVVMMPPRSSQTPAPSLPQAPGDPRQSSPVGVPPGMSANPAAVTGMGINAMSMGRPSSRAGFVPGSAGSAGMMPGQINQNDPSAAAMFAQGNPGMAGMQMPNLQNMDPAQAAQFKRQLAMRQSQMAQMHKQQMQVATAQQQQQQRVAIVQAHAAARQMSNLAAGVGSGVPGAQGQVGVNPAAGGVTVPPGTPVQLGQVQVAPPSGANAMNQAFLNQLTPQVLQQMLSNPQNQYVALLKQSVLNFSMLPIEQQMQRLQGLIITHRQRQVAAAAGGSNVQQMRMMQNGMAPGQIRQPNVPGGSNLSPAQMQQAAAGAMGMQAAAGGSMYPNVANIPGHASMQQGMMNPGQNAAVAGMAIQGQMSAGVNHQRQLLMMQQQQQMLAQRGMNPQGGAGGMMGGMNPGMMNAQALQQQQRMAAMQRGMSPLNPNSATAAGTPGSAGIAGNDLTQQQFAASLRSNPAVPGIARSTRSPSVSELGTPRLGGRMLSGQGGQSDEYHRALLQQQQQRNVQHAQMQQAQQGMVPPGTSPGTAQASGTWQNHQQMGQFGAAAVQNPAQVYGNGSATGGVDSPNPGATAPGNWSQAGFPHAGSPSTTAFPSEHATISRQTSATPAPIPQHSPTQGNQEEIYPWTQQ